LSELDKFVADIQLPAGSVLWTADSEGTVISRRPDAGAWFGKKIPTPLWKVGRERPSPTSLAGDGDGTERIYAFARVGGPMLSDYTVMIGVPKEHIVARARNDQLLAAVGVLATLAFALLAAWFGGDALIVRRVRTLAATANRIASGTLGTRTGMRYGNEEISELARSLDEMAAVLENKEAQRDAAEALLLAADKRKDEFLAMLAHELRNPLAPISAGAHILKQVHAQDAVVARTANIIVRQANHMTRLIDDLLDVSRVTRGLVELKKETLEFKRIVHDAVEQVGPLMNNKQQQLSVELPDQPVHVEGDHKRLVQVVANLLNNAAKYTPESGHIRLHLASAGERLSLTVSDDGIGMQPELIARVFDLFTQGERTSDRSQGGLGLGLALVKTLVQLHGGTVSAASSGPGQGSVFTVELPCVPAQADSVPERSVAMLDHGARLRCLVVDDNEDAAQMLSMFLEAGGHDVVVAHAGAEGLVMARAMAPQLCLLDIGLPDFDGNELAARLRKAPETAGATMVAVSGYGRQEDKDKAMAAGFNHYFVKPVDTTVLLALVNRLARERAAQAALIT
jgi:signal transduction histidine kinase/CheY-like chemotaxis protein